MCAAPRSWEVLMRGAVMFVMGFVAGATIGVAIYRCRQEDSEASDHDLADRVSDHLAELESRLADPS